MEPERSIPGLGDFMTSVALSPRSSWNPNREVNAAYIILCMNENDLDN